MEEQDAVNEWDQSVMGTIYTKALVDLMSIVKLEYRKTILFRSTKNYTCLVSSEPRDKVGHVEQRRCSSSTQSNRG